MKASARAAIGALAAALLAVALLSGGSSRDPRTPAPLPGLPPPFLTAASLGDGRVLVGVDAYGDVVDLRRSPAGPPLLAIPYERQQAGTVAATSAIVPTVAVEEDRYRPLWRAEQVSQRFRPDTNVLVTEARFGDATISIACAAAELLACASRSTPPGARIRWRSPRGPRTSLLRLGTADAEARIESAARRDRVWLRRSAPLGRGAPDWAGDLYRRSLLAMRTLSDARTGAVAAGARDGWAYVWPRDAGAVAIALAAAGHRREARRVARFLSGLDLAAAARFTGAGSPVGGRDAQGDAGGWTLAAAAAAGLEIAPRDRSRLTALPWRRRSDYQERSPGDYLGNALAAAAPLTKQRLARRIDDPASGADSAAAWAIVPFRRSGLEAAAADSLRPLIARSGRFGIVPSADWGERDPWTAPTAWSAWALAEAGRRQQALALVADLRRAATPAGLLPERVDHRTGLARSTTPLAWSHAFTALALRALWPPLPRGRGAAP